MRHHAQVHRKTVCMVRHVHFYIVLTIFILPFVGVCGHIAECIGCDSSIALLARVCITAYFVLFVVVDHCRNQICRIPLPILIGCTRRLSFSFARRARVRESLCHPEQKPNKIVKPIKPMIPQDRHNGSRRKHGCDAE